MLKRILKNVKLHSLRSALSFKTEPHKKNDTNSKITQELSNVNKRSHEV